MVVKDDGFAALLLAPFSASDASLSMCNVARRDMAPCGAMPMMGAWKIFFLKRYG